MSRRREAEGSINIGKCQDTKQWSILSHHNSKECEDNILKPLKIYIIQAAPFYLLVRK